MTICPKCSYERQETDINPEWECSSCGVAYVKAQNMTPPSKKRPPESNAKEVRPEINSNLKVQLLIVGFICLVLGYFAGREHLKYEVRSSMQGAFSSIKNGFSSNNEKSFIEEKVADIKTALKPKFVSPTISNKRFEKQKYDENIWFDITWDTSELKKPTRAIKGILIFADIFGESKFQIKKTINEPLSPNQPMTETGVGFDFNQFKDSHKWMLSTDLKDMTFKFDVQNIIYTDGTSESYE
ncbi:hypothetical protein NBRC116592_33980 [Colwellia sp. KU-HH00111]|uniref:hypothetical protein n=1 Tax=Colwellia sp. KU-HH00111 TaxID=3127652 RepID=UPI0031034D94